MASGGADDARLGGFQPRSAASASVMRVGARSAPCATATVVWARQARASESERNVVRIGSTLGGRIDLGLKGRVTVAQTAPHAGAGAPMAQHDASEAGLARAGGTTTPLARLGRGWNRDGQPP